MWYEVCGATHPGQRREHNEDHILVGRFLKNAGSLCLTFAGDDDFLTTYGMLFCVADGVGGAAAGEMASRLALLTLDREFYAATKTGADSAVSLLREASHRANTTLLNAAANKDALRGMGTTLSGVCLLPHGYWTLNAGDSRVYRYRDGLLKALTQDDTLATRALRSGTMTLEAAAASPQSHVLTNCLGQEPLALSIVPGPALRVGDILLVCSDGLYDMVDDDTIAALLADATANGACAMQQAENLIDAANAAGGADNISVILIRVQDEPRR